MPAENERASLVTCEQCLQVSVSLSEVDSISGHGGPLEVVACFFFFFFFFFTKGSVVGDVPGAATAAAAEEE